MRNQHRYLIEILTAAGLIVAPFILPHLGFAPNTVNRILVWGLFGIGFDILFGYTGLLSFGQSAFYGTGGFVAAWLLTRAGFPNVFLALIIGMISAAVVGYLVGLIALRRTGIYFAMITVAIAEVFFFVEFNPLADFTGGENGLPGVPTPSFNLGFTTLHFTTGWSLYQFLAACYFVGIVIALRIVRSPVGAILSAIRDNPLRAQAVGHNIHSYKLTAFVIAAAYAGFAGGLLGVLQAFMPPDAFTFETSGQLVMQTAIGGIGTLFGPLLGAAVWLFLQDFLQSALGLGAAWKLVLGLVFVLLVTFLRRGIIGGIKDLYELVTDRKPEGEADRSRIARRLQRNAGQATAAVMEPHKREGDRTQRADPAGERADQAVWRVARQQRHRLHRQSWRIARRDRAERRRQVDLLQDADLRNRADLRQDPVPGPRHHRQERHRRLPTRPDQELSGQPAIHAVDRAAESDGGGARRFARQVQARSVSEAGIDPRS